jgi:hypothetical protein
MTAVENSISGLTKLALSRILEVTHRKNTMDFEAFFEDKLGGLHKAGNYRVFADIERHAGGFPRATRYREDGSTQDVTVWCSNDYLGMGQNPLVPNAMKEAIDRCGTGRAARATSPAPITTTCARRGTCRSARQGRRADLHIRLRLELGGAGNAGLQDPRADRLFRCAQPRLDDRGHSPFALREAHLQAQ